MGKFKPRLSQRLKILAILRPQTFYKIIVLKNNYINCHVKNKYMWFEQN